jgi:NAD(P)-dependent dehydrogenase (short-subunit alcohol dehydrogenase family)
MEYMKEGVRLSAVAPGVVDTPMHASDLRKFLQRAFLRWVRYLTFADIVGAIVYLTEARHVTGEMLHVDAGAHNGKW